MVLQRDRYRCRIALPGTWTTRDGRTQRCLGVATQVHHTRGRSVTGDDPTHLVAACAPCNLRLGDPTLAIEPPHRQVSSW